MNSGNPEPADELSLILDLKRNQPKQSMEVVCEASAWLKAQFLGAKIDFHYTPCEADNHSAFSTFSVIKEHNGVKLALDLKVAEINQCPHVFAEVLQIGRNQGRLFPYFANIQTDDAKQNLLHYISDFLLI